MRRQDQGPQRSCQTGFLFSSPFPPLYLVFSLNALFYFEDLAGNNPVTFVDRAVDRRDSQCHMNGTRIQTEDLVIIQPKFLIT